ncbi:MAG: hypothetical protein JXL80_17940, partial [Planctomycetes bacterium]|nr:hypothetical protein [Planctomycetota bacterium]
MVYEIEVFPRPPLQDAVGRAALSQAGDLHLKGIQDVASSRVYFLKSTMTAAGADTAVRALMADPVSEIFRLR